jgi:hypothetical protein
MGTFLTKQTKVQRDRDAIAGIEKHFARSEKLLLDGVRYASADLVEILDERIALSEAVVAAKAAWQEAMRKERENAAKTERVVASLRKALHVMFGKDVESLVDFGVTPHKERRPLSAEEKVAVVAKILSTRAARHTMGKRQRLKIKGDVAPVVVVTSPSGLIWRAEKSTVASERMQSP